MTTVKKNTELTQRRLKELFSYDDITGVFVRKIARGNQPAGSVPGTVNHPTGRKYMMVDGNNNSAENLHETSRKKNAQNKKNVQKNNFCGFAGVNKRSNDRYRARIRVGEKLLHLGTFSSPERASRAYTDAKRQFHPGYLP